MKLFGAAINTKLIVRSCLFWKYRFCCRVLVWRQGYYIVFPKQCNGSHVGVKIILWELNLRFECKVKSAYEPKWPIRPELFPVSVGILLLPLDGMLVHRRVTPSIKFAGTHLYTWVERGTVRIKCFAQEHNTRLEPRQLAPKSSALTMRPPRLPQCGRHHNYANVSGKRL